ncbi:Glycosyltransferase involved in cell wall bisynthesis [Abditibacterium utsteinense]|uniref:Glycosyltransferase involved in cell wall bisynthesis n=1 Tax=Abditibacterium utsteinense TaxID=1960156 RepID=A0A2S8SV86_9BACT|nr:glycosyltransferase family 4 protein [Abditibacterium utsteinense]PQV64702.1 Glycosyltransferase involved in cell wall bisynthesis [Abditibacterium utsteinense]
MPFFPPEVHPSPTRITVVFFDHTANWSGGEISLFNLVTHLDLERFRPVVVMFEDGALREKLDAAGIETHVAVLDQGFNRARKDALGIKRALAPRPVLALFRYVRALQRILREENAQIVHCNSLKADVLGGIAARLARVPTIWHIRDRIADDYLPPRTARAFRFLARAIPTHIITVSNAALEALQLPPAHLESGRALSIHNGTVLGNFTTLSHAPFSSQRIVIGIVGRLTPWKGQHIFLEAAALVHQKFPDVKFQIVGAPLFDAAAEGYEAKLRRQTCDLHLENVVEWFGFRLDVPQLIEQMDVLVHASTSGEPFGQVIIEGMAAAKPVVATNGGGVPEIVIEGETGLLVPMGDAKAMADALLKLCANPQLAQKMGMAGRKRTFEKFGIDTTAGRVQAVYNSILNG